MGFQYSKKNIKTHSALRYYRRVIASVNKEEENAEGQKRSTMIGKIKVSSLSHRTAKQSDPKLVWEIFHKIYHMYSDIDNK